MERCSRGTFPILSGILLSKPPDTNGKQLVVEKNHEPLGKWFRCFWVSYKLQHKQITLAVFPFAS